MRQNLQSQILLSAASKTKAATGIAETSIYQGNVQDHGSGLKTVTVTINDEKVETEAASGNVKEIKIDLSAEEVSSIASKDGKYEIKIVAEDLAGKTKIDFLNRFMLTV